MCSEYEDEGKKPYNKTKNANFNEVLMKCLPMREKRTVHTTKCLL